MEVLWDFYLSLSIKYMKLLLIIIVIAALGLGWAFWHRPAVAPENMPASSDTPSETVSQTYGGITGNT